MKALSLWQPWASAIVVRRKRVETRGWSTRYRGPIAIHAAKLWNRDLEDFTLSMGLNVPLPRGAIVAIARLADVLPVESVEHMVGRQELEWGNYAPGRFAWLLDDVRPIEPIPFRGMQGLFQIPDEILP